MDLKMGLQYMFHGLSTCLLAAVTGAALFAAAADFPLEWLLLEGPTRARLVERLAELGRTNEVALLEAVEGKNEEGARSALLALIEPGGNRQLGEGLVRLLRTSGRTAEAQELARRLDGRISPPRKLAATSTLPEPDLSGKNPVVFLHGYNGDASTWTNFHHCFVSQVGGYRKDDILVFQYYGHDNSSGLDRGLTDFGFGVDTTIEEIADRVKTSVTVWLRRRFGISDNDASRDAELPAADWVCHSMGGLVFRNVLRDRPELVRRAVTLGTPHFGQSIGGNSLVGALVGVQAQEMSYGSSMIWNLAADWHFRGKGMSDILFIAGVADESDGKVWHDGLVSTFSATMQTVADAGFERQTFFLNRIHSTALSLLYPDFRIITGMASSADPTFRLVHGFLNDSGYFEAGARPTQEQVLKDDGSKDPATKLRNLTKRGALFVQVMNGTTNTAGKLEQPVEFDPGTFYPDAIVEYLSFGGEKYEDSGDGLVRENGCGDEGCTNGLVLLFGEIPSGVCKARIEPPSKGKFTFDKYTDTFCLNGGGTTIVRTRPAARHPLTALPVADTDGTARTVVVSNQWLAANGLVTNAENLEGCVDAVNQSGANGYPVAVSYVLGLDPADTNSLLKITSFTVGDELSFAVSAGGRQLQSGVDPVVLQSKQRLEDAVWQDAPTPLGAWKLLLTDDRFFRAVFRWPSSASMNN